MEDQDQYALPAVAAALREREAHWNQLYDAQRMSDAAFYSKIIEKRDITIREQGQEIERLQAVFKSIAPTNSKAYEGLLGTGQALIDKDAEITRLKIAASEATVDETEDYIQAKEAEIAQLKAQREEETAAMIATVKKWETQIDELHATIRAVRLNP